MNYPNELQELQTERDLESSRKKTRCIASENGGCFCTGRCQYTKEEWERLEQIKKEFKFTGVDQMKYSIGD